MLQSKEKSGALRENGSSSRILYQTTQFRLKLKDFADDNFKFDDNGRKFSKPVENTGGKGEIARYKQFLLFLHHLQKTSTVDMKKQRLVWERFNYPLLKTSSYK